MSLDLTFRPEGLATVATKTPALPVRIYASSIPGHVSVVLSDESRLPTGTRLTLAQVEDLIAGLSEWALEEQAREVAP